MSNPDADDRARVEFFRLGVHYYVAGRFAGLTGLFPMAGNLLHHAAEMFLKGALVRIVGLNKLRKRLLLSIVATELRFPARESHRLAIS